MMEKQHTAQDLKLMGANYRNKALRKWLRQRSVLEVYKIGEGDWERIFNQSTVGKLVGKGNAHLAVCSMCWRHATHVVLFQHLQRPDLRISTVITAQRDGWEEMNVDHILPVSCGGADRKENLRTTCLHCNSRRQDAMTTSEIAHVLARLPAHTPYVPYLRDPSLVPAQLPKKSKLSKFLGWIASVTLGPERSYCG